MKKQQIKIVEGRRTHKNTVANYKIRSNQNTSPTDFLAKVKSSMSDFFESHSNNKIQLGFICEVVRVEPSGTNLIDSETPVFLSNNETIFPKTNLEDVYKKVTTKIIESFSMYLKKGNGWVLEKVVRLGISVNKLNPPKGSSSVSLPKQILGKNALIKNYVNSMVSCISKNKWVYPMTKKLII